MNMDEDYVIFLISSFFLSIFYKVTHEDMHKTEKATQKVKETTGVGSVAEAKGKAAEVAGEAKGKAHEVAGQAKGKAEEIKGKM